MNVIKFILIISITLFASCKQSTNNSAESNTPTTTISFDFEKDLCDSTDLFNLIDSINIINLEINDSCLIGEISKISSDDKYIYILDVQFRTLFKYTKHGKFVLKISNIGKGPGEFLKPSDFILLEDRIVILDAYTHKIISFAKNGKFISEYSTLIQDEIFGKVDNNHIVMFNQNEFPPFLDHNISIIDYNGKVISKPSKTPPINPNGQIPIDKKIDYFNNELSFTKGFNNDILKIQGDSVCIKYHFVFGCNSLSRDFFNENKNLDFAELFGALNKIDVVNFLDYFNETSKLLFFICFKKGKLYQVYYNKQNKTKHIFEYNSLPEWYNSLIRPYVYSDDNILISVLSPDMIERFEEKYINEVSESKVFSKLESTVVDSDINDNPSLIVYYFK